MADLISGIKGVPPSYPIKPVQPGPQERRSGQRKKHPVKDRGAVDRKKSDDGSGDDDGPSIDEYV